MQSESERTDTAEVEREARVAIDGVFLLFLGRLETIEIVCVALSCEIDEDSEGVRDLVLAKEAEPETETVVGIRHELSLPRVARVREVGGVTEPDTRVNPGDKTTLVELVCQSPEGVQECGDALKVVRVESTTGLAGVVGCGILGPIVDIDADSPPSCDVVTYRHRTLG